MSTFDIQFDLRNPLLNNYAKEFPSDSPKMIQRVSLSSVPASDCFLPKRSQLRQKRQEKLKEAIEELATIHDVEGIHFRC